MYKSGLWGDQAKERSEKRKAYFREYARKHRKPYIKRTGSAKPPKHKESDFVGTLGETIALQRLDGSEWVGRPYDLTWIGLKVDVKSALPTQLRANRKRWSFALTRQKGIVDLYILFGLREDRTLEAVYAIPESEAPHYVTILIDIPSKYDRFRIAL